MMQTIFNMSVFSGLETGMFFRRQSQQKRMALENKPDRRMMLLILSQSIILAAILNFIRDIKTGRLQFVK